MARASRLTTILASFLVISALLHFTFYGANVQETTNVGLNKKQLKTRGNDASASNASNKDEPSTQHGAPTNPLPPRDQDGAGGRNETVPSLSKNGTQFVVVDNDRGDHLPKGLRLAFIGDSLIRYQYLSLLYYLHHGDWEPPGTFPSIVGGRHDCGNYYDFYNFSARMFAPKLRCDCFRLPKPDYRVQTENRYYYDPIRDNLVVLVFKSGTMVDAKGHFWAKDVFDGPFFTFPQQGPFLWNYTRWEHILRLHLGQLSIRPRYVILNQGLHHHLLGNVTVRNEISRTLKDMNMVGLYRTLTKKGFEPRPLKVPKYEVDMCRKLDLCLNVSWVWDLTKEFYFADRVHFREPIYRRINEQMFAMIRDYEDGRTRSSKSTKEK